MTENKLCNPQKSSFGMDGNIAVIIFWAVAAVLMISPYTCVLSFICPLIFLLKEKESAFVRFHAEQCVIYSVIFSIGNLIVGFLADWSQYLKLVIDTSTQTVETRYAPLIKVAFLPYIFGIIFAALAVLVIIKANTYEAYKLPVAGPIAEKAQLKDEAAE